MLYHCLSRQTGAYYYYYYVFIYITLLLKYGTYTFIYSNPFIDSSTNSTGGINRAISLFLLCSKSYMYRQSGNYYDWSVNKALCVNISWVQAWHKRRYCMELNGNFNTFSNQSFLYVLESLCTIINKSHLNWWCRKTVFKKRT